MRSTLAPNASEIFGPALAEVATHETDHLIAWAYHVRQSRFHRSGSRSGQNKNVVSRLAEPLSPSIESISNLKSRRYDDRSGDAHMLPGPRRALV